MLVLARIVVLSAAKQLPDTECICFSYGIFLTVDNEAL
jgi:hypothetical protein